MFTIKEGCKNNPGNSSTTKVGEHISSSFSMSAISSFKSRENKHHVYRGKDCPNKFCSFLKEQAIEITDFFFFYKKKNVINKRSAEII